MNFVSFQHQTQMSDDDKRRFHHQEELSWQDASHGHWSMAQPASFQSSPSAVFHDVDHHMEEVFDCRVEFTSASSMFDRQPSADDRQPATPPPTPRLAARPEASGSAGVAAATVVVVAGAAVPPIAVSATSSEEHPMSDSQKPATTDALAPCRAFPASLLSDPRARYSLHKELHQSIYGKVYLGTDESTGKHVALKVSIRQLLDSHTSLTGVHVLENPMDEVKMMQRVGDHPNVVSLVAVHEDADLHWMVQEFVGGGELYDALAAVPKGHFSEDQARSIFAQVLAGLTHIHLQGVAHLDVSLENMLVDTQGAIKICDLGLARCTRPGRKLSNNGKNRPGKLGYMAPEVLAGEDFDGEKADVFSAGVVLFTLLTGHPPFEYASTNDKRFEMITRGRMWEMLRMLKMSDRMSPTAANLLTRMLHPMAALRISLQQIAAHPWLSNT